jgi:hypothetical protein
MRQGFQADPLGILASSRKTPLPPDLRPKARSFLSRRFPRPRDRIKTPLTRIKAHHAIGIKIAAKGLRQGARAAGGVLQEKGTPKNIAGAEG